jgi:hypothetical protein
MKKERQSFRMRVDERFFADLNELRRHEDDVPDNTEMVRRLIERALMKVTEAADRPIAATLWPNAATQKLRSITKK